ncbi:MAG: hypothetical protein V1858_02565 [Candidatus Gottesmanbacteria bacterium]
MNKKILNIAIKKFKKLKPEYKGFINVGVDNWRGFRFIFDTQDVRNCKNNCSVCPLYQALRVEKKGLFSAGLYPASKEDKKLFGKQNYLNCKTLKQYQNCYVSWLVKKAKTRKKIEDEIKLIKNFRIIYSNKKTNIIKQEVRFRQEIINKVLQNVSIKRSKLLKNLWYTKKGGIL